MSDSFAAPWTVAHQAPLSMGFDSHLIPSPGDLPNPGIRPAPPAWQVDSLPLSHREAPSTYIYVLFHILFNSDLLQEDKYSSLCCAAGLRCLSILFLTACIC